MKALPLKSVFIWFFGVSLGAVRLRGFFFLIGIFRRQRRTFPALLQMVRRLPFFFFRHLASRQPAQILDLQMPTRIVAENIVQ